VAQSILVECAGQILDNVSDAVNGPVQGTVTLTSTQTAPLAIPKGLLGTLADGRVIRVRAPIWVYHSGTSTGTAPCRLDLLGPTLAPNNFSPVTSGMTVTWISPPSGLQATGTIATTFAAGPTPILTSAPWGSFLPSEDVLKTQMTQGAIVATLHFPKHRYLVGGGIGNRNSKIQLTWTLRIWASNLQGQRARPTDFAAAIQAVESHLYGAQVMSDVLVPEQSGEVKTKIQAWCHEMKFNALVWTPGRVPTVNAESPPPDLADLYATILLPGDGVQSPSFEVAVDAKV
jgi:hypothetical protein